MSRPARSPWTTRFVLWAAVCALLLKAAVPMLATASAELQGKTLVEVCTVYGVATVALDTAVDGAPAPADHAAPHAGDHCVLTGLLALGAADSLAELWPGVAPARAPPATPARTTVAAPDAAALWAARLRHGPPPLA